MNVNEVRTDELVKSLNEDAVTPSEPTSFEFNRDVEIPREKPSLFGALMRTENPIVSGITYMQGRAALSNIAPIPGYNWRDGVPVDLQDQSWQYVDADSPLKANEITDRIRKNQADRARISDSPWAAFGMGLITAPLDPTNYIPGGTIYKNFNRGANVFKSAKSVALSNMISTIPQEAILLSTQYDRDFKEAAANFLGAGVFGGIIGGVAGAMGSKAVKNAKYDVADIALDGIVPRERPLNNFTTKSEAVNMMTQSETKLYERQNLDESIASTRQSDVNLNRITAERNAEAKASGKDNLYFQMSIQEIVDCIKTSDIAINTHNMVQTFVKKGLVPENIAKKIFLPASVIKKSTFHQDMSKKQLVSLAIKSEQDLAQAAAKTAEIAPNMNKYQAALVAKDTNSAAYARMSEQQAIREAGNDPEISLYSSLHERETVVPREELGFEPETTSVGAAQATRVGEEKTLEELIKLEELAGAGRFVTKVTSFISPRNAMMNSPNPFVRQLADMFFESSWIKNKFNPEGANITRDISVETAMKVQFGAIENVMKKYMDIFYEQAGVTGKLNLFRPERALASREGYTLTEFGIRVATALRNGDVSDNPAVQQAAQLLRAKGFEPLKKIAIAQGRLPENVSIETADSYLTRLFNKQLIKENQTRFYNDVQPWFYQKNEELKAIQPMLQEMQGRIDMAKAALASAKNRKSKIKFLKERLEAERLKPEFKAKKARIAELKNQIRAERAAGEGQTQASLKQLIKDLEQEMSDAVPRDLKDSDGKIRKVIKTPEQLESVINQTIDNVLGRGDDKLSPMAGRISGGKVTPLQNRSWLIPDEMVEPYLVNDPLEILETYAKQMIPELELGNLSKKIFDEKRTHARLKQLKAKLETLSKKEFSELEIAQTEKLILAEETKLAETNKLLGENPENPTIDMAIKQVMREAADYRDKQILGADPTESASIEKAFSKDEENILVSIDILRGVYKQGSNTLTGNAGAVLRNIKKWNVLRYMGYMVISSLPDVAMHVLRHGPGAFVKEGLMPSFKQINGLKNIQYNKELLQDLGRCIETAMGQRLKAFVDGEPTVVQPGKITKTFDYLSNRYGNATLFNQWQDLMQFISGNMSISRTLRTIDTYMTTGKMSKSERLRLNALGISKEDWAVIHDQWKKHGGIEDGSYWSDYGSWDVENPLVADAFNTFKASIVNEIDSTNVRPGMGDKPKAAYDPIISMMLQFRSFMLAATNTVLASGLSRNDQNFYMGLVSLVGMGGLAYCISSKLKRPDEEVDLSPGVLLFNAIDRSGALGVFMEGFNVGHKLLPIGGNVTRYQQRSKLGNLLGPTAQAIDDIAYVLNAAQNSISEEGEPLSTKDIQKMKALAPFQNLFWLDGATKQLLNQTSVALGAEEA